MHKGIWLTTGALIAALAFMMLWFSPQPAQAELAAPTPTNPPPTWTPGPPPEKTVVPPSTESRVEAGSTGAITLLVRCTVDLTVCEEKLPVLWTQVEAQNPDGSWTPVPGWKGNLTRTDRAQGQISWWFGTQVPPPLRWIISEGAEGELITISDAFQPLPEVMTVFTVNLPGTPILLPASGRTSALAVAALAGLLLVFLTFIARIRASS